MGISRRETADGIEGGKTGDGGTIDEVSADEMSRRHDVEIIVQMNVDGMRHHRDAGITGQMIVSGAMMTVTGHD